jgi:hypothetical protein
LDVGCWTLNEFLAEFSNARGGRHRHVRGIEAAPAIQGEGQFDQLGPELVEFFQEGVGFRFGHFSGGIW